MINLQLKRKILRGKIEREREKEIHSKQKKWNFSKEKEKRRRISFVVVDVSLMLSFDQVVREISEYVVDHLRFLLSYNL